MWQCSCSQLVLQLQFCGAAAKAVPGLKGRGCMPVPRKTECSVLFPEKVLPKSMISSHATSMLCCHTGCVSVSKVELRWWRTLRSERQPPVAQSM
jgi:hypothetical protein